MPRQDYTLTELKKELISIILGDKAIKLNYSIALTFSPRRETPRSFKSLWGDKTRVMFSDFGDHSPKPQSSAQVSRLQNTYWFLLYIT